jgi:ADP-ribose pyrophosphatase YjhB (NUDIX family)
VIRRFPLAVHIFFIRGGSVLLLRRFNTGYEDGNYSVPAGHLEGDETVVQAAIREAREEIGVELRPDEVAVVGTMHRKSGDERVDFFVVASVWTGERRTASLRSATSSGGRRATRCPATPSRTSAALSRTTQGACGSRSSAGKRQRAAAARPVGQLTPVPPMPQ